MTLKVSYHAGRRCVQQFGQSFFATAPWPWLGGARTLAGGTAVRQVSASFGVGPAVLLRQFMFGLNAGATVAQLSAVNAVPPYDAFAALSM